MARPAPRGGPAWEQEGYEAILDLVQDRLVAPWPEVESRISQGLWKDFASVQPLQLSQARRRLRNENPQLVIEETTAHPIHPVITLRVPFSGNKKEVEAVRGEKRRAFRTYLAWTANQDLCGHHAERVVLDSMRDAASDAGLFIPPQTPGQITSVLGVQVPTGPLDALAFIMNLDTVERELPLLVEVKNLRHWLYPWSQELWELLAKAAAIAATGTPVVPLLACPNNSWTTFMMAQDIGFLSCPYRSQLFNPSIHADEFTDIREEFGLAIDQHEGPFPPIVTWFRSFLRKTPPPSPPPEDTPFYRRQADRFSFLAEVITDYSDLAQSIDGGTRQVLFADFREVVHATATWDLQRGW